MSACASSTSSSSGNDSARITRFVFPFAVRDLPVDLLDLPVNLVSDLNGGVLVGPGR